MNREEMLEKIKQAMPEKRFQHTLGVEKTAILYAEIYGESTEKASVAALLHDYAKYYPDDQAEKLIRSEKMDPRLLEYSHALWHAPVGAYLAKHEFGVTDAEILEAIRVHTTGSAKMNKLDKILFLADYTEPGRDFPGVEEARVYSKTSLDAGMLFALRRTIAYISSKEQPIFPDTFESYNAFAFLKQEGDVKRFE
ncbi:bis(5'-nucleosyl)-tetraphosphatase (symmetrical) YqeK [Listeria kieliensis]|uniref:bis(5'-nucleosyl)-tetraphosphatase (symmetrical) n=1 Tax=Listeria kieliensis TaxID=1621700 RepID=A0A3D8TUZ4_9LIST|nr:bis(5'-nucleosyl)-tetraphosphatase (symmetrical) YqeK [Listeria kieliensis]RDX02821.1 phosphohydrolase [Listeria kieliensis]